MQIAVDLEEASDRRQSGVSQQIDFDPRSAIEGRVGPRCGPHRILESLARSARMSAESPKHVLDGYKVLDFTQIVAGPTATLMMAEMGAEVIKVELTPAGDPSRMGPFR